MNADFMLTQLLLSFILDLAFKPCLTKLKNLSVLTLGSLHLLVPISLAKYRYHSDSLIHISFPC